MTRALSSAARVVLWSSISLLSLVLVLSTRRIDGVPEFVTILLVAAAALAAWKPAEALIGVAALIPVATWLGRAWNGTVAWPETLVVAFAAGYAARCVWNRRREPDGLDLPLLIFTTIVGFSLLVRLTVLYQILGADAFRQQLWDLLTRDYFVGVGGLPEVDAAMRLLEGMLLLRAAAATSTADARFAPRLVGALAAGAAAAAALNLWRLWLGASRLESPVATFLRYLATIRINVHYGDVNAAGSYFVMILFAAVGLAWRARSLFWTIPIALIASSVWLSGSRTALLAGGIAALALAAPRLGSISRGIGTRRLAATAFLLAAVLAAAYTASARRNLAPPSTALEIRKEFAKTSFRMLAAHPIFGVEVGQYFARSFDYGSARQREVYPATHENAHNNFLQVLAELGLVGFAAFLWLLIVIGRRLAGMLSTGRSGPLPPAVAAGLAAFVLTWLAGHPLLVDAPAFAFWLLLGTAAGWQVEKPSAPSSRARAQAAVALLCIALASSVSARAEGGVGVANLEHRGVGLSQWQHGDDGVRYRMAGGASSVFIPAGAGTVVLPLRSARASEELKVTLRLDGSLANVVTVPGTVWHYVRVMTPPQSADGPRFHRLDLEVEDAAGREAPVLLVGKAEPR